MTQRNTSAHSKRELLELFQRNLEAFVLPAADTRQRVDILTHMSHLAAHIGVLDTDAELHSDATTGQTTLKIIITPGQSIIKPGLHS